MRDALAISRAKLVEAARAEDVLMTSPGRMVGGTLTLTWGELEWERSPWALPIALPLLGPILALIVNKGPNRVSLDVSRCAIAPAGRMVPWPLIGLMALTWWGIGLFVSVPIAFRSGWSRPCIAVHSFSEAKTYYFAVRDVDGWIEDIMGAGGRKGILGK